MSYQNHSGSGADDSADLDALFGAIEEEIEAERGPRAWLRSRSTPARVALAVGMFVGLTVGLAVLSPRSDLSMLPWWRVALVIGALAGLFGASLWFSLEPLHRAGAPVWVRRAVVGAALAGMAALAWLPLAPMDKDDPSLHGALPCLYAGVAIGLPAFVLFRWMDRGGRPTSAVLAAAGAALASNAATSLHCGNDSALHILQGHLSIGVVYVLVVAAWRWATKFTLAR